MENSQDNLSSSDLKEIGRSDFDQLGTSDAYLHNQVSQNCEKFLQETEFARKTLSKRNLKISQQLQGVSKTRVFKKKAKPKKIYQQQTDSIRAGPRGNVVNVLMIVNEDVPLCYYVTVSNPGTCPANNFNAPSAHLIKTCWLVIHDYNGIGQLGYSTAILINETLHGGRESRRGSEVADKWGEGDSDGTFD
jgi:hypothetical protein